MIGTQLGAYQIIEEIGRGGMAVVYRARQESVGRDVAVKVILQNIAATTENVERFKREARLVARLEHPHILPLYDFDGAHQPPYLVMRYLNGGTLKDLMARGPLSINETIHLLRQIALALDYAHRQGVIHRDVKPSNMLIDLEGNAFVSDFGIARVTTGDMATITQIGHTVGTPDYMSPEQIAGRDDVDNRADLYALTAVLFEMLTGRPPFADEGGMLMIIKHMQQPPPSALSLNPTLPAAIDDVIQRGMAKEPKDRYASAAEFATVALQALGANVSDTNDLRSTTLMQILIPREPGIPSDDALTVTPSEQNRIVTSMCANAVDYFTLMEEDSGVEAARRGILWLWARADQVVRDHGGRVVSKDENELLAMWGADETREDDPERAIRAALALHTTVREQLGKLVGAEEAPPLSIGINTGSVLLMQDGTRISAAGSTINVAERMADIADGTILIGYSTFRSVRGVFDMLPGESLKLRGRKDRIETYSVTRAKARAFRMATRGVEDVDTHMVGREAELKVLQNAFLSALEDAETEVVTISGGAGVGKSRLLYEFHSWAELRPEFFRMFQGRATPDMMNTPYALLRDMLAFRFEILDSDPPPTVREKLVAGVSSLVPGIAPETAPLLGALAGFDFGGDPNVPKDGDELVRVGRAAFVRLITGLAPINPILMMLEDAHYADDATLDALTELASTQRDLRMLVVVVSRPDLYERRPMWGGEREVFRRIDLQPLDKRDTRALAREILQKVPDIPKALVDLVAERAEGNPYYVEELVKMLIDDRVIFKGEETWSVDMSKLENLAVPPSLVGLLQARLDSLLAPERLVLGCGAAFGRFFWSAALTTLDETEEGTSIDLGATLAALVTRGFLYRRDNSAFAGTDEYAFEQSMLRDVMYDSLVERQRAAYHAAAARWLEGAAGERAGEYTVAVAEHYAKAGEAARAVAYLLQAGDYARRLSANRDALAFYSRAHELNPDDPEPLVRMAQAYTDTGALVQAMPIAEQALTLSKTDLQLTKALDALARAKCYHGDYAEAETYLNEALPLARAAGDLRVLADVLGTLTRNYVSSGRIEKATESANEAYILARAVNDPLKLMTSLNDMGLAHLTGGNMEKAAENFEELRRVATEVGTPRLVSLAVSNLGEIARIGRDFPRARDLTEQALVISRELGNSRGIEIGLINLSDILIQMGDTEGAGRAIREALQSALDQRMWPEVAYMLVIFAKLRKAQGDEPGALALIGLAKAHPAHDAETLDEIGRARAEWGIDPAAFEAGMAAGEKLDFDAAIAGLLKET